MSDNAFETPLIQLANVTTPSIIKVIGVGGGGGNAVGQMYLDNIPEVRYLVANTDSKALADSPVPDHLQMGAGLGAGGNPVQGREQALDSIEKIDAALDSATKWCLSPQVWEAAPVLVHHPLLLTKLVKKAFLR